MVDRLKSRADWDAEVSDAARAYAPQLHRFLLKGLGNDQDARDAAQEVFLRLARAPHVELIQNPIKYLYGIARYVVAEIHHRRSRELVEFNSELTDQQTDGSLGVPMDPFADSVATLQALNQALDRLRPLEREIIWLIRREGMSYEEVAQALNIKRNTVKKYACKAMAQLRLDWASFKHGGRKP
jgi:RNA polymerase sigma factor (sigma-70 family)